MVKSWRPDEAFYFVPLGGSSEIGMNLNLYACHGKWMMVDCGAAFADDSLPGIDIVLPDVSFVEKHRKKLLALVLTHGHEDHIGAVPHLWSKLRCPIYATPFTAELVSIKLNELNLLQDVDLRVIKDDSVFHLNPFKLRYIPLAHSIAEGNGLLIETDLGRVFHTGDWKLDPSTTIATPTSNTALQEIGQNGILAMVCDSTNIFNKEPSRSEQELMPSLKKIISSQKGRVVITTFASNVERLQTVAKIAKLTNRHLVTLGRSMKRIVAVARNTGYLRDIPPILSERELSSLPRDRVLVLSTGCQGEPRSALSGVADGTNRHLELVTGDSVIFSSKIIPGNERPIGRLINKLVLRGVNIITEKDSFVHVSGHPSEPEVTSMYNWMRPAIAIPVHGEARHIAAHTRLAEKLRIPYVFSVKNGEVIKLAPGKPCVAGAVESGYVAVDGNRLLTLTCQTLSERRRINENGVLCVSIPIPFAGQAPREPIVHAFGLLPNNHDLILLESCRMLILREIDQWHPRNTHDIERKEEAVRLSLLHFLRHETGKRPLVSVKISASPKRRQP